MHEFADDRYEKMAYRRCGRSGLKLPAVSLGFWQSIGEPGREDLCRQICYDAFDAGVTHFDLANNYGPPPGNSENVVGEILKDMPRDELVISTKAGYYMWPGPYGDRGSRKYLIASLDQSLQRLGLDYVDIYYHHRPDPETPLEETLGALNDVVRQGKALYVGVSNYSGELTEQACRIVRDNGWAPITIHQPYYNMLGRGVEQDLLPTCRQRGIGVIPFCPLAQGLLTDKYLDGLPEEARFAGKQEWYDEQKANGNIARIRKLNEVAANRGQTLAQLALTWLLRNPEVVSVLIGVSRPEQLAENVKVAQAAELSSDERARIDAILSNET
jgi:L-glyceraldehyde 3-phosphate reductase